MSSKGLDNSSNFFKNSKVEDDEEGMQKYSVDVADHEFEKVSNPPSIIKNVKIIDGTTGTHLVDTRLSKEVELHDRK